MAVEVRVMQPGAKELKQPVKTEKGNEWVLLQSIQKDHRLFNFSQKDLLRTFDLQNYNKFVSCIPYICSNLLKQQLVTDTHTSSCVF